MSESEERELPTEPEGRLEPPARKPPTAIGTGTPEPGDEGPGKEIVVTDRTRVRELAKLMHVATPRLLWAAFNDLGRIVTVNQILPLTETKALAAHYGYSVRRAGDSPGASRS